jgi:HSP20 family protein
MEDMAMPIGNLVPWRRDRQVATERNENANPFLQLHRQVNRLFDDAFRGFDLAPFSTGSLFGSAGSWPNIEVSETDKDIKVTAELPGLDEKDVQVELADGVLAIRGEKKTETEDKDRLFTELHYGRFERRIPLSDVEKDEVAASFRNGVLSVTLPKSAKARQNVRRIEITT